MNAISKDTPRINEEIRARELRVVGPENEQIGIMSGREALALAEEQHLDLVEIAPNAKPPVARIMNYGKYRYEQQKREKEAKKKQKIVTLKEVKLRPHIEDHDFYVKMKNASKFLAEGNKVKVTIMFRGRELSHPELGMAVLTRFAEGRIMPKIKTRRAAAKRFAVTGTGEFKRAKAFKSHILEKKSPARKRNLRKATLVAKADHKRVAKCLPYA